MVSIANDKQYWHVRDIIISLVIIIILHIIVHQFIQSSSYLANRIVDVLIDSIVILILNEKYSLRISPVRDFTRILQYVLVGSLFCLLINFPYGVWTGHSNDFSKEYSLFVQYGIGERILFLLLLGFIGPTVEEVLFRGFFYRILRNRYDIFWGATISTALYALSHGISSEVFFYIFIPGLIYVYVYEKTNSILSSILTHSLNNTLWFVFTYWGIKGE
jgi:membrane protease YdiL (CAAX protease family)